MPSWESQQYLQFEQERTRPSRDLIARIYIHNARTAIDLGCGPGNSTAVAIERWPRAKVTGLDNSTAMLERARQKFPQHEWIAADLTEWAHRSDGRYDIVFSNAALQWVPDHDTLYPRLLSHVSSDGALAIQVPANMDAPAHQLMRDLASSRTWRNQFATATIREWYVHEAGFYYDLLSKKAKSLDLWETEYIHIMPNAEAIGEWYRGSGLRPYLDALSSDNDRDRFVEDYVSALGVAYVPRPDGRVLFPFRRLFLIAYK